jgi:hypothetical protein
MLIRQVPGIVLCLILFIGSNACSQNILALERDRGGNIKLYHTNDYIKLSLKGQKVKIAGRINYISDTSLVVNFSNEVLLEDIDVIYHDRTMIRLLQSLSLIGGFLYISISALNGVINNDSPLVHNETLKISGGMLIAAVLLTPLTSRRHRICEKKWKVKILDFTD